MDLGNRARLRLAVFVGFVAVAVSITAAAGFVFATDDTTGEDVLEDVEEKYNTAESVSVDTVVTVETDNGTATFDASVATAGDENLRLNVSDSGRYVLSGTNGDVGWVSDPTTGVTGVLDWTDEDAVAATLRAGTDEPTGAGLSAVLPGEGIEPDDTVGDVLSEVDENELPPELRAELDALPANATVSELAAEADLEAELDTVSDGDLDELNASETLDSVDLPEEWNESAVAGTWNGSAFDGEWNGSEWPRSHEELQETVNGTAWSEKVDRLREKWNDSEWPEKWNDSEWPEKWNDSEWPESHEEYDSMDALVGDLNASDTDLAVDLVGTTTVDGQDAYELLLTHPDAEGDTRLWVGVDSTEVLKLKTTTPDATVAVDVVETRFDVSPADSTFQPPGTTELARFTVTSTETPDGFGADAPFQVAVPGDAWTFEHGWTATGQTSIDTDGLVQNGTVGLAAEYADGERSILVAQGPTAHDWDETVDTETVGDREVLIESTEHGVSGTWVEDGTTTTVAGDLSERELRSIIAGITFETTGE